MALDTKQPKGYRKAWDGEMGQRASLETRSCFLHGDYTGKDTCPRCEFIGRPEPTLAHRLGWMAEAIVSAKGGPQARFFTRERVDEIVLLLREAEKRILEGR